MPVKNMVVLFDETGTPAISNDQRTDWFILKCCSKSSKKLGEALNSRDIKIKEIQ
jgi:hypothetical protein